jgi:hypothetical protein
MPLAANQLIEEIGTCRDGTDAQSRSLVSNLTQSRAIGNLRKQDFNHILWRRFEFLQNRMNAKDQILLCGHPPPCSCDQRILH